MQGSPMKPAEETIMNSLENSSMAIEAGNNIGNQSDQVNKSNIDKPIIDTGTSMTKLNNVVMRVINGVVISVTILVTLFMRSSGSSVMSNQVRRGFYCDDLSIRYPVRSETVSTKVLIGASFIGGLTLFCIIEYCVIKCNTYLPMHSDATEEKLEDQLKSFPSAHASFAAFMAFYLVLYVHERFKIFSYSQRSLLRPFLQLCILSIYWWSALTRVSDFVHHPIDVLVGLLLGTLVALWSWTHLTEMLTDIDQTHKTLKFSIT